jgi:ferredoxin-NADP reductase
MLRYIEDKRLPHRVTLIYSSRDRASAAFLDELEEIARTKPNVHLILTMTEDDAWAGERRRIDVDFFQDYLGDNLNAARYMVAGPPAMAQAVSTELEKAGAGAVGARPVDRLRPRGCGPLGRGGSAMAEGPGGGGDCPAPAARG